MLNILFWNVCKQRKTRFINTGLGQEKQALQNAMQ